MICNLKLWGLALIAVCATSAVVVSAAAASTKGWLTSDGPVTLTGTDTGGEASKLTGFGNLEFGCHGHYDIGTQDNSNSYDEFFDVSETTVTVLTVKPTYDPKTCTAKIGGTSAPLTVTMNECDYAWHLGETKEPGVYNVTSDVECPESKEIEIHWYSSASHATTICTMKIPEQTGRVGATASTEVDAEGNHTITLQGPITGITANRTGILCGGTAHTEKAELDIHAILSGFNEGEEPTGITITHETE
jgi:hypothetical protein